MNLKNKLIYIVYLLLIIGCKTNKTEFNFIDISAKKRATIIIKNLFKYEHLDTLNLCSKVLIPTIYTNVSANPKNNKFPRMITSTAFHNDFQDIDYFKNELKGQYVLYMENNNNKVIMRESARYYNLGGNYIPDNLKINTEDKVYKYLKDNNIKYKFINKRSKGDATEIKILLEPNKYYTFITISPDFIVSNMYYTAKDTLCLYNNYGSFFF